MLCNHLRAKQSCTHHGRTCNPAIDEQATWEQTTGEQAPGKQTTGEQPTGEQATGEQATSATNNRCMQRKLAQRTCHYGGQMNTDAMNASACFTATFIKYRISVKSMNPEPSQQT